MKPRRVLRLLALVTLGLTLVVIFFDSTSSQFDLKWLVLVMCSIAMLLGIVYIVQSFKEVMEKPQNSTPSPVVPQPPPVFEHGKKRKERTHE